MGHIKNQLNTLLISFNHLIIDYFEYIKQKI